LALAIFDLDNTLIAGDSDHAWGEFLISKGAVDPVYYKQTNDKFYQDYVNGVLDMQKYLQFALEPLAREPLPQLLQWRKEFSGQIVAPIILKKGRQLLAQHRDLGDHCLIITATNRFIAAPIADLLGVDDLIATEPEFIDGRYTGNLSGIPSYQKGKVDRLNMWLADKTFDLTQAWFYSDSHNDLPLLERVGNPVAVDPDEILARHAMQRGWNTISLR